MTSTGRCSTARCAASIRPARPSSRCLALAGLAYHAVDPQARVLHRLLSPAGQRARVPRGPQREHGYDGPATMPSRNPATCTSTASPTCWASIASPRSSRRLGSARSPASTSAARSPGSCPRASGRRRPSQASADQMWFPGETVNFGIGQGYLQRHAAAAGALRQHHRDPRQGLASRAWSPAFATPDRRAARGRTAVRRRRSRASPTSDWDVRHGRHDRRVTQHGTAAAIGANAPYTIAGKTGTAQVFSVAQNEKYNASDDRRAPARSLLVHRLRAGRSTADRRRGAAWRTAASARARAAPIARKVLDAYLLERRRQASSRRGRPMI